MKRVINYFVVFTLFISLLAGLPIQPKAEAATLTDAYGFKETPFALAPNAFTFPDKGYIENIKMIEADDTNNLYVIANETYVNASDIFHFTTDGNFLGRLITRDQLAAQLTGANWNTSGGAPTIEPVKMAFSKEGANRYLYIVLKVTNSSFPMIKLDVSTNTVVEPDLHVFTTEPSWMQKGKDGLISIATAELKKYYMFDTKAAPSPVMTITTTLSEYINGIVSTGDDRYLVMEAGVFRNKAYVCNEPHLTTCIPLDTNNRYSNPAASENGEFSALGGKVGGDNYLFLNENSKIKLEDEDVYSLDSASIEFTNNGDLIVGLSEGIKLYTYNDSERSYTYASLINSYLGEAYESEFVQMIANPDNGHFFVADQSANMLDEFDGQGIYIRSKAFTRDVGKVVYHDGYFFTLSYEGSSNMDIISADNFSLLKTVSINPNDILLTPTGQLMALYNNKLEQYSWNAATKELVLEHTYPVGGSNLNMHGDGEQITFIEKNSLNMYMLNPNTHQYVDTTHQIGFGKGVMDSSGFLIYENRGILSIVEPNYGAIYQNPNKLYSHYWSYYSKDTYLIPKKVYDPASKIYKIIPVLVQMTTPDSNHEASFTTVTETQQYSATLVPAPAPYSGSNTVLNLGIKFPFNGPPLDEIQIKDDNGYRRLFFTGHPETGITVNGSNAIYHAVIGSEPGKRMAVIQFSNIDHSWNKGTLQLIFFEETGEIVIQAEAHQPTTNIYTLTYRLQGNEGSYQFPSGAAQSINLVKDSFISSHSGRAYIPLLLKTGNTLTAPILNAPVDKVVYEANEDEVILEWSDSNSSANYDKQYLLLSTDPSFITYQQMDVTNLTSYNLSTSKLTPGTPYYWKVLTVNTATAEIAMSNTRQFAFKNWVVDVTVGNPAFISAPVQVTLDTLNLNFFKKVGVAVSTSPNPTVKDELLNITAPYQAVMSDTINGLQPNTVYYARAFATDGTQTRYSQQVSFKTEKFEHSLQLANVNFIPTVTAAVYSATVPYEVSVTRATYDQTKGITSAELWVEGSPYGWETDIPLKVGLNTIAVRFVDAVSTHDSTVYVTREAARVVVTPPPTSSVSTPSIDQPTAFDIWINGDGVKAANLNGEWRIISSREEKSIKLEISQKAWTELFVPQGFVQLEHQGIEYRFPVENVITDQMKQQLELSEDTKYSVVLHLQVDEQNIQPGSLPDGVVSNGKLIKLKLEIQAGEKSAVVDRYSRFAQLRFPIDPTDLTTAVRLDEKGIVHIPTKFITRNGKTFAELSLISNGSFTMIQYSKSFNDLQGHWAQKQIQELANRRVIDGFANGSFQPNQSITRAELAAMTARALGLGEISYKNGFKDVSPDAWYANELEAVITFDLLQGYADGSFQGDSLVTREQAIVVLNRIAKLTGIHVKEDIALSALTSFKDASQISSWATNDVGAAISSGIIQGRSNGQISPQEWMTRAELSAILYRWLLHTDRQS